jgi:hypothetical protein
MKVKQGRISLYTEQKIFGHPWVEFDKKTNSVIKNLNYKNDPRALNEKKYLCNCIKEIITFLEQNGFELPPVPRFLFKPSNNEFIDIFIFLIKKIDYNYNFYGKWDEEIPFALKFLKYPFSIPKNSYSLIPSMYMWPILLGYLKWLVELLDFNNELHIKEKEIIKKKPTKKKFLWDQLLFAYRFFLFGDEGYKKIFEIIWSLKKKHNFYVREKILKNKKFFYYLSFKCISYWGEFFFIQILHKKSIRKILITTKKFYLGYDHSSSYYEKKTSQYLINIFIPIRKRTKKKILKEIFLLSKTIKSYLINCKIYIEIYKNFSNQICYSFLKINFIFVVLEIIILKTTIKLNQPKNKKKKVFIYKMEFLKIYRLFFLNGIFKKKYFSNIYKVTMIFFVFLFLKFTKVVNKKCQHSIDLDEESFLKYKKRDRNFKKLLFELLYLNQILEMNIYVSKIKKSQDLIEQKHMFLLRMFSNKLLKKKVNFIKKAKKILGIFNIFNKTFQKIKPYMFYFFLVSQKTTTEIF